MLKKQLFFSNFKMFLEMSNNVKAWLSLFILGDVVEVCPTDLHPEHVTNSDSKPAETSW